MNTFQIIINYRHVVLLHQTLVTLLENNMFVYFTLFYTLTVSAAIFNFLPDGQPGKKTFSHLCL